MKKGIILGLSLFLIMIFFSCASAPATKGKYAITIDSAVNNPFVQSVWLGYTAHIRADMEAFYKNNPEGEYIKSYNAEKIARNSMIEMYLRIQKEQSINDEYIEDLIKIRSADMFDEYVFFSFNTGNWNNEKNFQESKYKEWMANNLPNHKPLTLAKIEKLID